MESKDFINISCADLVKKSAKAICFFRNRKAQFPVTERMKKGNEVAQKKSTSAMVEMRGTYKAGKLLLHYTFDEIKVGMESDKHRKWKVTFIEHKNIEEGSVLEEWYVDYCVLQVAFYHSLMKVNPSKKYVTAKFFQKLGYEPNYLDIANTSKGKNILESVLFIGDFQIKVDVKDPKKIVDFFVRKAKASFDYEKAMEWDLKWKFKEFAHLKKYIKQTAYNV